MICCLASRHIDDPRARADPEDGGSAGAHWFELFGRLRTTPSADRPTVHTVQAVLVAGVYAIGAGKLSKAFALLAESVTLAIDLGLHRDSEAFDCFDPIEDEVRRRTFFCVYLWDKQASAHFGRPPMIRMRDCDVGEPVAVDDEFITHEAIGEQPAGTPSRIEVFMAVVKVFVVLESVLNRTALNPVGRASPLFVRAADMASGGQHPQELAEEESLLNEICQSISPHWMYSLETMSSGDVIRVTQAERFHCVEQFVRMLIHRHRFQEFLAERWYNGSEEQSEAEMKAIVEAHTCTLQIVTAHIHIATKGLMTYCKYLSRLLRALPDLLSRRNSRHPPIDPSGKNHHRRLAELHFTSLTTPNPHVHERFTFLRCAFEAVQRAVPLRAAFVRYHGRVLQRCGDQSQPPITTLTKALQLLVFHLTCITDPGHKTKRHRDYLGCDQCGGKPPRKQGRGAAVVTITPTILTRPLIRAPILGPRRYSADSYQSDYLCLISPRRWQAPIFNNPLLSSIHPRLKTMCITHFSQSWGSRILGFRIQWFRL